MTASRRLLVLVKQVPETENVKLDPETGTMLRSAADAVLNPLDLHAVEEAVRIRERSAGKVSVSILSMGPPIAKEAVRDALALGCDSGFLVTGKELAGADTWATAYTLAQAIRTLGGFTLVLCGERATDGETGQVGPMTAAFLNLPILTYVSRIVALEETAVTAQRAIEGGHETVECQLPAVISVVKEINEPRLPTLAGKIRARQADICVLGPDDIDAERTNLGLAGSPTRVVKVYYPRLARAGRILSTQTTPIDACVAEVADFVNSVLGLPKRIKG
jgi:electron transfer flavoprotein beta subunit